MTKTQDIRDAVELELSYDPLVDMSDITVKNINGEVALNGTVPSFPQYLEAAAAARRVSGVKNVHNHLEVVLPTGTGRRRPFAGMTPGSSRGSRRYLRTSSRLGPAGPAVAVHTLRSGWRGVSAPASPRERGRRPAPAGPSRCPPA